MDAIAVPLLKPAINKACEAFLADVPGEIADDEDAIFLLRMIRALTAYQQEASALKGKLQ